jgi:hypothetical protein
MQLRATVTVGVFVSLAATTVVPVVHADDPIAALNRSIQERFREIDKLFGLRRIVVIGDTPHQFKPENAAELAAVQGLKDAGFRVALYVAGRRVLDREPDLTTKEPFALNRRVIFGPVVVTDRDYAQRLPQAVDLIEESRIAFRTLVKSDRYDFRLADRDFSARAIRATSLECLSCHRGRQLGEPLGVLLYAYQSR